MRVKLDENLPVSLRPLLQALQHDVDDVMAEGMAGGDDAAIWAAAQEAERSLITQDLDFSDVRAFPPGAHYGVLVVRLAEPGRKALTARIGAVFRNEEVETWHGCFVVLTDHKLRIRRP